MKRLILSVLAVFAIAAVVVGCTSGNTPGPTPIPVPTVTPTPMSMATSTPTSSNTDLQQLQGTWIWTQTASNQTISLAYTFSGNNWTLIITTPTESEQESGTFTIDPTANPKTIDMYMAACTLSSDSNLGQTGLGIYQLSGTRLTMVEREDLFVRPTSFTDARVFVKQ